MFGCHRFNTNQQIVRQFLRFTLSMTLALSLAHGLFAQQNGTRWDNMSVGLRIGFHHVGMPLYKIIDNPFNLSISAVLMAPLTQDESKSAKWYQNISLTWYSNSYSSSGFILSSNTVFQKYIYEYFFVSAELGLGMTGIRQPAQVYGIDAGNWEKNRRIMLIKPVFLLGLSMGYKFSSSSEIFLHYNPFADLFYPSLAVLPQGITSLGYRFHLK